MNTKKNILFEVSRINQIIKGENNNLLLEQTFFKNFIDEFLEKFAGTGAKRLKDGEVYVNDLSWIKSTKKINQKDYNEIIEYLKNPETKNITKAQKKIIADIIGKNKMYVENFYGELINHMKDKGIDENQFLDILIYMSEESPDKNLDDILIELLGNEYEIESLVIVDKIIDKFINRLPERATSTNLPDTKKIIDKNVNVTPVRAPKEIDNDIKKIK